MIRKPSAAKNRRHNPSIGRRGGRRSRARQRPDFYRTPPLETALDQGDVRYYPTPNGDIFYQVAGEGTPLLLVHGIGAANRRSNFDVSSARLRLRPPRLRPGSRRLRKSDKPAIDYTAETYID